MKTFHFFRSEQGIATIPTVMALTILVLVVGASITALSLSENMITYDQDRSAKALMYAEAGARDALVKIARDRTYTCATADCYAFDTVSNGCTSNEGCARISVSAGVGSVADPKIVTSKGQAGASARRIQVTVTFDSNLYGEIESAVWEELTN